MPIRVLPPDVAARIAAGEVVERPASVVKELVENSLDAGATRISVEITGGGIDSIKVSDDGSGIAPGELATAFERHATSKLRDDADLARVATLGFRGEALPSIAAVADVEVVSREPGSDVAAYLRFVPGAQPEAGARGAPEGTSITVRGLFERLPARKRFLRTPGGEANAIASVVTHYALAYPEVRFRLAVDGRQTFATPGSGNLRDAVAAVYGLDAGQAMLEVSPGDGPFGISGLVGPPQLSRSTRAYVSLFVNRRWVQNRRLAFAVEDAYRGMLMTGRHPVAVLNITIDPAEVDVNVHPTKAEIRFRDESAAFSAVQKAVRAAVVNSAPVAAGVSGTGLTLSPPAHTPPLWEAGIRREDSLSGVAPPYQDVLDDSDGPAWHDAAGPGLGAPPAVTTPPQALPVLRVIGQYGSIYIIAEGPEGMYLIDQHAAHERVLYERFRSLRAMSRPEVQGLLDPLPLDLSPRQSGLLASEAKALAAHGFEVAAFGESSYLLRSVPRALAGTDLRERFLRFLDVMLEEDGGDGRDRVAMSLACHGAIRAGKTLTPEEMRDLVRQLEETEAPHTCPHGRPTMVHVSAEMLAKGFGRR